MENQNRKGKFLKIGLIILTAVLLLILGSCIYKGIAGKKENTLIVDVQQTNNDQAPVYDPDAAVSSDFNGGSEGQGTITYTLIESKDSNGKDINNFYLASDKENRIIAAAGTPAGIYTLKIRVDASGDDDHAAAAKEIEYSFVIDKAEGQILPPKALEDLIYNGKLQALVEAGSSSTGKLLYKVNDGEYSEELPGATDAGVYTVYYKVEGNENYKDVDEKHFFVTIARKTATSFTYGGGGPNLSLAKYTLPLASSEALFSRSKSGGKPDPYVNVTYNGNVQKNGYYAPEGIIMSGSDSGVNAGEYIAVYTPDKNHSWSDGSFAPVTVRLKISRAVPKAVIRRFEEALVYNDSQQQLLLSGETDGGILMYRLEEDKLWSPSIPKAKNAADYAVYCKVVGDLNYEDIDPIRMDVSIAKKELPIPSAVTSVYTGLPQSPIHFENYDRKLIRLSDLPLKINAGTYDLKAALKDPANYKWPDGSSEEKLIPWTITKAPISVPYINGESEFTYSVMPKSVKVEDEHLLAPYVSRSGVKTATNAGTYEIVYTITDGNHCWEGTEEDSVTLTWVINKAKSTVLVEPKGLDLVYNEKQQVLIEPGVGYGGNMVYCLSSDGEYSEELPTSMDVNRDGITVYYKVQGDENHLDSDIYTVTAYIDYAPAKIIEVPLANILTYNGEQQELVTAGTAEGGSFVYRISRRGIYGEELPTAVNAGEYYVYYKVVGDEGYSDTTEETIRVEIMKADIDESSYEVKAIDPVYNRDYQPLLRVEGEVEGGTIKYSSDLNGSYTSDVPERKNVGEYVFFYRVDGDNNHNSVYPIEIATKISKADIDESLYEAPLERDLVYNGNKQQLVSQGSTTVGTMLYGSEEYGFFSTVIPTGEEAGTYDVYYKIIDSFNYNDLEVQGPLKVEIKPRGEVIKAPKALEGLIYNGEAQILVKAGEALNGELSYKVGSNGLYSTQLPSATAAGTYEVYYKVINDDPRADSPEGRILADIGKADIDESSFEVSANEGLVYNGQNQELVSFRKLNESGVGGTLVYSLNGSVYTEDIPTGKDAGAYTVYYKVIGDDNHNNTQPKTIEVRIDKADISADMYTAPEPIEGLYCTNEPQELLSAGSTKVGYILYSFDQNLYASRIPTGTAVGTYRVFYKIGGDNNYNDLEVEEAIEVTIVDGTSIIVEDPEAIAQTCNGQMLPLVKGGKAQGGVLVYSLDGEHYSEEIPSAEDAGSYKVYYYVKGTEGHQDSEVRLLKAEIYQAELKVEYGDKEFTYDGEAHGGDVKITTVDGSPVTITYKVGRWGQYSEEEPLLVDPDSITVYFKASAANHHDAEGSYKLKVSKLDVDLKVEGLDLVYNGESQQLLAVEGDVGDCRLEFSLNGRNFVTAIPEKTTEGKYNVYYRLIGDKHHNDIPSTLVSASIDKAALKIDAAENEYTYADKAYGEGISALTIDGGQARVRYKTDENGKYALTSAPKFRKAGTYTVYYEAKADHHHTAAGSYQVVINKATADYLAPQAKTDLIYNGEPQQLLNKGKIAEGQLLYSSDGSIFGSEVPSAVDAGEYKLYYRVIGDDNHGDTEPVEITVSIAPKALELPYIDEEVNDFTYDGEVHNVTVSGVDGTTIVIKQGDIEGVDAGEYQLICAINDSNYCFPDGSRETTLTWQIAKADITADEVVEPSSRAFTYDGELHDLIGEGYCAVGTMLYSADGKQYSETLPQAVNAGDYTVLYKVRGDRNHNDYEGGSVEVTVAKAQVVITAPKANALIYNGEEQELIEAGSTNFGVLLYSKDGRSYSSAVPSALKAGRYNVYYKVEGNNNYDGVSEKYPLSVDIARSAHDIEYEAIHDQKTFIDQQESYSFDLSELISNPYDLALRYEIRKDNSSVNTRNIFSLEDSTLTIREAFVIPGKQYRAIVRVESADSNYVSFRAELIINWSISRGIVDIKDAEVEVVADRFKGSDPIKNIIVTYAGEVLTLNEDYKISAYEPVYPFGVEKSSESALTIEGLGDFSGSKTVYFDIYAEEFEITFYPVKNNVSNMPSEQKAYYGTIIRLDKLPTRSSNSANRYFNGWALSEKDAVELKPVYYVQIPVEDDLQLYAVFSRNKLQNMPVFDDYFRTENVEVTLPELLLSEAGSTETNISE